MKQGFTLLEIIIATLIASILSAALLMTIMQVSRLRETVANVTTTYGRIAILQNQLERDLMGAFIPTQIDVVQTTTEQKAEKPKPIDKVFYSTNKDDLLELLSFITDNPLQIYFGIKHSKMKPRIARVVYRLVPDDRIKKSFILMRQEGTPLSFTAYGQTGTGDLRAYPLIDGIQSLSMQYWIREEKKGEGAAVTRVYRKQKSWDTPKPQTDPKKRREAVRLPYMVEVFISLWDSTYQSTRAFTLLIPVMAMSGVYERAEEKKQEAV